MSTPSRSVFPELQWGDYSWEGEVVLPSWAGFQRRRRPYARHSSGSPADGSARLIVEVPDDKNPTPPTAEQSQAFRYLLDNEARIAAIVLQAIFERYPEEKEEFADAYSDDGDVDEILPDLDSPEGLRSLMGLSSVFVLTVTRAGVAYVGFEFGCVWEEEHGLGVMLHQDRIVKIGQAADAFLAWIAERDAGSKK
jgi:hypothetical protein